MTKVIISNHAVKRMRERFRLRFPRSAFETHRGIENLMIAQLQNARRCERWKQVPFYRNRAMTEYGPDLEVFERSGVYYACREPEPGRLFCMTVFQRWHCEHPLMSS